MSDALDLNYWDACIFYEHLKDEPVDAVKKQAIEKLLTDNEAKRNKTSKTSSRRENWIPKLLCKKCIAARGAISTTSTC